MIVAAVAISVLIAVAVLIVDVKQFLRKPDSELELKLVSLG